MKLLIALSLLLGSNVALASEVVTKQVAAVEAKYEVCLADPENISNMGMKLCTGIAYNEMDGLLNKVYGDIVKKLRDPEILKRLIASERAWIKFRDVDILLEGTSSLGGSGETLDIASANYEMTKARILQLDRLMNWE